MDRFIRKILLYYLSFYHLIITPASNFDYLQSNPLISYLIRGYYSESDHLISNLHLLYYHTKLKDYLLFSVIIFMGQIHLIIILVQI